MAKSYTPSKYTEVPTLELAYVLVDIGDAQRSLTQKVYPITKVRLESAAKRLRFMLGVEGKEEKKDV